MKILANDGLAENACEKLRNHGHTVITAKVEQMELPNYINKQHIDVVLVRSATQIRKELIDACPDLKLIGRGGVGMDNIDVEYARSKGKIVFNTPASSSQSVAEMAFAHLFSMYRFLYDSNRKMQNSNAADFKNLKKKYGEGLELRGKTLGLIGIGRIGQATAKYALGLGMKVVAHDPFIDVVSIPIEINGEIVTKVLIKTTSLDEVLKVSDAISLHVPKQKDGSAVIGKNEISAMKEGVFLLNLSRGGVIDEDALIEGLNSGKVAAAGLDVFENEPLVREDILNHAKISLSPHIGAATNEAQDRIGDEIVDIILENAK
jgi:D-3-phosphoglycerate dehydrogenase